MFWLVLLLTARAPAALFAALLFAVHPLHVESVAWISERKDVLYAFFYLAAMIAYVFYAGPRRERRGYAFALGFFALSLLSKPMAVTLPLVLLLLDYLLERPTSRALLYEKLPFILAAGACSAAAMLIHRHSGVILQGVAFGPAHNAARAVNNIAFYLQKLVWPARLSCVYPYRPELGEPFSAHTLVSLAALAVLGALVARKPSRSTVFGTGFFLVTLLPVLQFVPIGHAVTADRYTYVPYLGLFFIAARALDAWAERAKAFRLPLYASAACLVLVFAGLSRSRAAVWQDSLTLWNDVLAQHQDVELAYNGRAYYYNSIGDCARAILDYDQTLRLNPGFAIGYNDRGTCRQKLGDLAGAIRDFDRAVELDPRYSAAYYNRGNCRLRGGDLDGAAGDYTKAIEADPKNADAYNNRGVVRRTRGRYDDAMADFDAALRVDPVHGGAASNRKSLLELLAGRR